MILTILGNGNATATKCYNTCFTLSEGDEYFLIDGGGGNAILNQLSKADISIKNIKHIFVTHKHIDHLLGIIWLIRIICQHLNHGKFTHNVFLYAHVDLIKIISDISSTLLQENQTQFINKKLFFVPVFDGEKYGIMGHDVNFFDIHSTKCKQFGFTIQLNNKDKLTCCGDEPYNEHEHKYAQNSKWLLHEAFCLHSQVHIFKPYEKNHSTVKDVCILAEKLGIPNLLLYHTEDKNLNDRERLYLEEGQRYFSGNLYIPNDLDNIEL